MCGLPGICYDADGYRWHKPGECPYCTDERTTTMSGVFSDEQLKKIIADTLPADAKPGEKVVVAAVNSEGVKVVASFKLKEHWELQAAAEHTWAGNDAVGAKVLLRW
jgi:hypothetical protein